jgi:hypothetical protein
MLRPTHSLLHTLWDLQSSSPAPLPCQGCATPNSHPCRISMVWDLKAGYPQTFTIATRPCPSPQACTALHYLCSAGPHPKACCARDTNTHDLHSTRPQPQGLHNPTGAPFCWAVAPTALQDLCFAGHAPKACRALQDLHSAGTCPQACHTWDTNTHDLHSAGPAPQSLHSPAKYSLHKPVLLRPAKVETHTHAHTISILLDHAPPSLSSQGSTDMQDRHSTGLCP